jgi:DNA-binding transcriptional MerR regulator
MNGAEPSLSDLASASGIEPRTIRSWVAQGLLAAPLTRGPLARYPADTLERVLAIRAMRDLLGMPLAEIRKELLVASPDQIRAHANRAAEMVQAAPPSSGPVRPAPAVSGALDYIGNLRAKAGDAAAPPPPQTPAALPSLRGFEALEQRLGQGRAVPARKAHAAEWLRIPITPDFEFAVRAPLDAEQQVRLERCADLIRDILLGRDR